MGNQLSQMFPPAAKFTEQSVGDLSDKVYIVTGASAGAGKELSRLLYSRNGTVYLAARSQARADSAIQWIKETHPNSTGRLHFLHLDLNDLQGIKPSAEEFLKKENRLDVLFNNAGVMVPPQGSTTKQGYELQLGTNCVAPFLFTKLLTPILIKTAKKETTGSVRVIWVSSSSAELVAPTGGLDINNLDYKVDKSKQAKYAMSKAGNVLHALEMRNRFADQGVVSVPLNPGNLTSELTRHISAIQAFIVRRLTYPPVNGAYTEFYAGLSPDIIRLKANEWVIPWGRIAPLRKDLVETGDSKANGGSGQAKAFWEWSEEQVAKYS
ncbi:retinol dehydrogenase 12 [Zopfia rhizophila CBS 207.26]|uniref:Retinol dehydrogenase 12 n=1 Tax=Zopfia rhizophila CBS 207.26 TaxID=1314779 RepID=A0A6A6E0Z9_9PEZI|nr:retinol dehydrogenase 12 [Zopfia rhizophila CBS 207.26]